MVEYSTKYNLGKVKYPMTFCEDVGDYKADFPCAECSLMVTLSVSIETFRKKRTSEKTKKKRLCAYAKTEKEPLICRACGCKHKVDVKNFSITKIKIKK